MNPIYIGAVRHIAQAVAGALVTKGVISADGTELVVGALTSVVTLGWYLVAARAGKTAR